MRCRDCGFDPCACGNENYEDAMKSVIVELGHGGGFFSKTIREHQEEVARQTGLPWREVMVRFLSVDVQANTGMIFYSLLDEEVTVETVYPGTPEWEASEKLLEVQRREGG